MTCSGSQSGVDVADSVMIHYLISSCCTPDILIV